VTITEAGVVALEPFTRRGKQGGSCAGGEIKKREERPDKKKVVEGV